MAADSKKTTVLVCDDDRDIRSTLELLLSYEGYRVRLAALGREALEILAKERIDILLLDIKMPERDGLDVLQDVHEAHPDLPVIMVSGHGDIKTAVTAVQRGAVDFMEKPLDGDRVLVSIRNHLQTRKLRTENQRLKEEIFREFAILGESTAIQRVLTTVDKVARSQARVLVTGENGTGKELIARRIHMLSDQAEGPFVPVNCAAIPAELLESELFGHEQGAFTGAHERRIGKFEQADGGTLFLDEIGEMELGAQAKVLRALERNEIQRVGGTETIHVEIRVIAATNKDLQQAVEDGEFRMDLFYRLNVVPLHVPPLRDRGEDVSALATEFLVQACRRSKTETKTFSARALEALSKLPWPGNVRELKNVVEGLVVLTDGATIDEADVANLTQQKPLSESSDVFDVETFEEFKDRAEAEFLRRKLAENNWIVKRTAENLKMQRSNLYKKLEKYKLK
ncbi:MAG: sigma-54-dependent Fis family transcriptional regulator [Planctomycetes bacterium]|nr:sigma-54-dependent Fis family transcriptional regulator [Planctomycetota bacterium]